jgi:transposase-like protein
MLLEDIVQLWICSDCKKTFLKEYDAQYHKEKTSHSLYKEDLSDKQEKN